jgi:DNA-binding XRE family transcriptional regulator
MTRPVGRPLGSVDLNGRSLRVPSKGYARDHVALNVGEAIRRVREMHGVAAEELACALECSRNTIMAYERGAKLPPLHMLWRISAALGCRLESLTGEL